MIDELFKYRSIDNFLFKLLADQEIHFSLASEFNDPYDSYVEWDLKATETEWKNFLFKRWPPDDAENIFRNMKAVNFDPAILLRILGSFDDYLQQLMYVFSLSSKNDKTLMWSHYAQNHTGICLGFKTSHLKEKTGLLLEAHGLNTSYFDTLDHSFFAKVYPVEYSFNTPPPYNPATDLNFEVMEQWLLRKHEHWRYEDEWRVIIPTDWVSTSNLKFTKKILSSVTFGLKTEPYLKSIITDIISKNYGSHINFFQMKMQARSYLMEAKPL